MILDVISIVILLAILVLIFLLPKRLISIERPQTLSTPQKTAEVPSEEVPDFETIREAFIEYVEDESSILQLDDFNRDDRPEFIGYESGCPKESSRRDIWINVWMPPGLDRVFAVISIREDSSYFESYYKKLKEHKSEIETAFSFDTINPATVRGNIFQLRVEKDIDLTQTANRNTAFHWLRETLEKLYWVLRVQETLGWSHTLSESQSSPNYLEPFNLSGLDIRERRIALGLTQVEVARELGMKDGTSIGDWENERAKIPPKHHSKLLEILKLTPLS